MARDGEGRPAAMDIDLLPSETILGRLEDPSRYPELDAIRRTSAAMAVYHSSEPTPPRPCAGRAPRGRADPGVRRLQPRRGFATLGVIRGDTVDLRQAVDMAFPRRPVQAFAPDRGPRSHDLPEFPIAVRSRGAVDGTLALFCPGRGAAGLSPAAVRRPQ